MEGQRDLHDDITIQFATGQVHRVYADGRADKLLKPRPHRRPVYPLLPLASIAGEVKVPEVLLASSVQHGNDKLEIQVTLSEIERGYRLGLLYEGKSTLRVWTEGVSRQVKVHQCVLHVLVLLHAVGEERATCNTDKELGRSVNVNVQWPHHQSSSLPTHTHSHTHSRTLHCTCTYMIRQPF